VSENKKELTRVQQYAVNEAAKKVNEMQEELQSLLKEIAKEHGIDLSDPREQWRITKDNRFLVKQPIPEVPKNKIPSKKKGGSKK
jgi:hypothetical protein